MGKFQAMNKYFAIFLALVACHNSPVTHGRKIKPSTQHYSSKNTETVALESQHNPQSNLSPLKTSFKVPTPSSDKNLNTPMIPNYEVASFGDSSDTNAFRPTTPGGSPGVGHRKVAQAMVAVQSPDLVADEGSKDDFQPTDPGHSPGVGHSHQNKIGQPN
ncbi:hypothetical protein RJT34_30703 [Clitoria ternatea]|uniref:Encoded peptide n=1 Tax=Clitoria ternatea TaxID=43366 RepID=A0AAN9F0R3_CLITE